LHEQEEGVNISANSVHPGLIATNLFRAFGRTIIAGTCSSLNKIDFVVWKEEEERNRKYLRSIKTSQQFARPAWTKTFRWSSRYNGIYFLTVPSIFTAFFNTVGRIVRRSVEQVGFNLFDFF
jgi:NAD(P)-dependent dehydrogenase (short-subunit alcohol dehydrogenase family)